MSILTGSTKTFGKWYFSARYLQYYVKYIE